MSEVVKVTKEQVNEFIRKYNHYDINRVFFMCRKDENIGNLLDQTAEEAAELVQAVIKFKRAIGLSAGTVCSPDAALEGIIEEYADVVGTMEVLLESLKLHTYIEDEMFRSGVHRWRVYKRARALMRYYGYTVENAAEKGIRPAPIWEGEDKPTGSVNAIHMVDTAAKLMEFASRTEDVVITDKEANVILSYMTGPYYFLWEDKSKGTLERITVSGRTIIDVEWYTLRDLITSCANANSNILSGKTVPNVENDTRNFEHDRDVINDMYTRIVLGAE